MPNWDSLETEFTALLQLKRPPVAVSFLGKAPEGVERFVGSSPAGCSFWRLASEGRVFYTVASDHYNCAIGSHTHNFPLPPELAKGAEQTLSMMFQLEYVRPEELPQIPQLARTPAAVLYAPLGRTPVAPSVVLFLCSAASAMFLHEAATHAGSGGVLPILGRPTCMALPAALQKGAVASLGCIGNRVYTGINDDELYFAVPGADLERVAQSLRVVTAANAALSQYAHGRLVQLSAS
ncbi:MAG TPA: DUF169 domain-containing protein [Methylomirabilota bacterium]|nr:DUF169 domain-containing protein [Methylomirabilota bacterium]